MPRQKLPKRKQVNFRLDMDTYRALKRFARVAKVTRTKAINDLIRSFCE